MDLGFNLELNEARGKSAEGRAGRFPGLSIAFIKQRERTLRPHVANMDACSFHLFFCVL